MLLVSLSHSWSHKVTENVTVRKLGYVSYSHFIVTMALSRVEKTKHSSMRFPPIVLGKRLQLSLFEETSAYNEAKNVKSRFLDFENKTLNNVKVLTCKVLETTQSVNQFLSCKCKY